MSTTSVALEILARDRGAARTIDNVADHADRAGSRFGKLGGVLKGAAKAGLIGVAAGGVLAGKALFDMAKGAAEDHAAQVRLATALRNTAGANKQQVAGVERYISRVGVATGVTDDEMRPAFQRLVASTGSISKSQKLMGIALDASAGTGKSLAVVTNAMAKAQDGSTGALGRLGVKVKDADGKALSLTKVTANMAKQFKGQSAAAADTYGGRMKRLSTMFAEAKESIGYKLLPILTKLSGWFLAKGVPAISKLTNSLAAGLGPIIRAVGKWIGTNILPALMALGKQATRSGGYIDGLKKTFHNLQPAISLVGGILKVTSGIMLRVVLPAAMKLATIALPQLGRAIGLVGKAGIALWNKALAPTFRFITGGVGRLLGVWGGMLRGLSHVPGFGWARNAGDAMISAGRKASEMAGRIRGIPNSHRTSISTPGLASAINGAARFRATVNSIPRVHYTQVALIRSGANPSLNKPRPGRATGGRVRAGLSYDVGETGVERFVPDTDGMVVNANGARRMRAGYRSSGDGELRGHVVVDLAVGGRIVQQVRVELLKHKRLTGQPLGLA